MAQALLLAQRWSKYMAVTFAAGAVTGTVLSFEFGLLWPRFMGEWGYVFGVSVGVRGPLLLHRGRLRLDLQHLRLAPAEAVDPLLDRGALSCSPASFGSASVVAANAWMNDPSGFTLNSAGEITKVDPMGGDLQRRHAPDGRPHDHRRLCGRRVPRRIRVRGGHAAW